MKSGQTPLAHRMAMLCLVVQALQMEYPTLSLRPNLSDSRSLNTIHRARGLWGPTVTMTFVVGADLLSQLPRWYRIDELLAMVDLLVIPRPGYEITLRDRTTLSQLGARYQIADLATPAVSSSRYRNRGDRTVLPPNVANYIHTQDLYI